MKKIQLFGMGGSLLKPVASYLTNTIQFVKIDDSISTLQKITSGVLQGSLLGPLLFLLDVSDPPETIPNAHSYDYAHDYKKFIHIQQGVHDATAALGN